METSHLIARLLGPVLATVGIGMGKVLDYWKWDAWAWVPLPFAVMGAIIMSTLWNVTPGKKGH